MDASALNSVLFNATNSLSSLTMFNNLDQTAKVRQNGAAHEDGDLLHNLDACVPSLPGLLAFTHSFQEREERGDPEGGGYNSKGSGGGVSDILVHVVNIRSHRGDHSS